MGLKPTRLLVEVVQQVLVDKHFEVFFADIFLDWLVIETAREDDKVVMNLTDRLAMEMIPCSCLLESGLLRLFRMIEQISRFWGLLRLMSTIYMSSVLEVRELSFILLEIGMDVINNGW